MVDSAILRTSTYLENLAKERTLAHFPGLILKGLHVIHVGRGTVRCKLTLTHRVLKEDNTFHTAVIAMLVELMGAAAVYSIGGSHVTIDLSYSSYLTAKIEEEVTIEARVVCKKEDLNSAVIEIRRANNEELIATGRLWTRLLMTPFSLNVKDNVLDQVSKL